MKLCNIAVATGAITSHLVWAFYFPFSIFTMIDKLAKKFADTK